MGLGGYINTYYIIMEANMADFTLFRNTLIEGLFLIKSASFQIRGKSFCCCKMAGGYIIIICITEFNVGIPMPEAIATLPPFCPIEGQKWFDQISSQ